MSEKSYEILYRRDIDGHPRGARYLVESLEAVKQHHPNATILHEVEIEGGKVTSRTPYSGTYRPAYARSEARQAAKEAKEDAPESTPEASEPATSPRSKR